MRERWFKRFSYPSDFRLVDGKMISDSLDENSLLDTEEKAGEVIVIRKFGSRSSYYGIPDYVSSIGSIVGSQAVRDYNINYFTGKTIPDAVLFVEGVDEIDDSVERELKTFSLSKQKENIIS